MRLRVARWVNCGDVGKDVYNAYMYLCDCITTAGKQLQVWMAAFSQVFYSYALAFGSLVTFGSFNKFNTNCYR